MRKTTAYARKRARGAAPRANPDAHLLALSSQNGFTESEKLKLMLEVRVTYEKLRTGTATERDFDDLAQAVNVCLLRAEMIGHPALIEQVVAAQTALLNIRARFLRVGKFGMAAPELRELPAVLDIYEQLIDLSTPRQMHEALMEVLRRLDAGVVRRLEEVQA